jgi:hypothetical protein
MIAAVRGAPCALQRRTKSGLQARPLIFNNLQTVVVKLCHNCDTHIRYLFAIFTDFRRICAIPAPLFFCGVYPLHG